MVSNILDNFDDIDSEEQSMFVNLNIRNRRQKLHYNMSFETEMHDIYEPIYTSEEETSSASRSDTSSSYYSQEYNSEAEAESSQSCSSCISSQ